VDDPEAAVAPVLRTSLLALGLAALLAVSGAGAAAPLGLGKILVTSAPGKFTLRIQLNQSWKSAAFAPATANSLRVLYDSDADGKADYTGRIVYLNGALVENISGHGNRYEPVPVSRPTSVALQFTHPLDVLYTGVARRKALRISVRMKSGSRLSRVPTTGWLTVPQPR
jgi:hypothetical protein